VGDQAAEQARKNAAEYGNQVNQAAEHAGNAVKALQGNTSPPPKVEPPKDSEGDVTIIIKR
jgi:hypothetical protein